MTCHKQLECIVIFISQENHCHLQYLCLATLQLERLWWWHAFWRHSSTVTLWWTVLNATCHNYFLNQYSTRYMVNITN